jgi:hypothetical protein
MNHPDAVWVFDIDGTLIGSVRSDRLRPGARELIGVLRERGTTVVAWSAGGADYAERMLARFDLHRDFSAFYAKEARGPCGRYLIDHLPPEHRPGTLVDDYPDEVSDHGRIIRVRQFLGGNPTDTGLAEAIGLARQAANAHRAGFRRA